ncbi:hypothetical protein PR048_031326 [Dryococelus australis]|uniref:Uncharacterized protein n=1 Tax=Dryococelus australis TaxID=614101 RepID=A0ABQ9G912_9NEOP|nr:hypothetical protein PR048_031326 [Dryococelus australis]
MCLSGYEINQNIWVNLQKSKTLCQLRHNACKEPDTNENFPMPRPLHQPCQTELEIADHHDGHSSEGEEEVEGFRGFPMMKMR